MKTLWLLMLTLLSLSIARPDALAQGRDRDDRQRDRVCFYRDVQFQGWEQCYAPGDELADLGSRRNEISSIRVFGRARVIVFDQRDFDGPSDAFNSDVADLTLRNMGGSRSWNDRIDSFEVESPGNGRDRGRGRARADRNDRDDRNGRNGRTGICVYEEADFRGRSQCWEAGQEERNLNRFEGWNDRISSIRVFGRARAAVYRDAQFKGQRLNVDRDIRDLGAANWDDQISSLEVR
jgi:hypothetical protein